MFKNVATHKAYQRQGIASELTHLINAGFKNKILSDTELSTSGEALWNNLIRSKQFTSKIFDMKTKEIFNLSDAKKIKTSDGIIVKNPADDDPQSQRFFYLLESKKNISNLSINLSEGILLQPWRWIDSDD